ncbi:hypothetical protein Btru_012255 [Bulinus truncatus]|nr:hypothetical protein Btru_012255 [Bulinus truncatus]
MPVNEECDFEITAHIRNLPHTELKHTVKVNFGVRWTTLNMHVEEITWSIKENSNEVNKSRRDEIMHEPTNYFATKAHKLLPGSEYEFRADYSVTSLTSSKKTGTFIINVKTKGAPAGNGCRINPTSGLPVITSFSVICDGYVDSEYNQALLYRLYQLVTLPNGENVYTLIAFGNKAIMANLTLSGLMKDGTFPKATNLKVEIANIAKSFTSVYLNVSFKAVDQKNLIKQVSSKIQNLTITTQDQDAEDDELLDADFSSDEECSK